MVLTQLSVVLPESLKTALKSEEREEGIGFSFDLPTGVALRPQGGAAPEVSGVNRNAIRTRGNEWKIQPDGGVGPVGQGKLSL